MGNTSASRLYGWLLFIVFEVVVFFGLQFLLSGIGTTNQFQAENTIVPNWVKAILFVLLYLFCLLIAIMMVNNFVPSKNRKQLMTWVYLALIFLLPMVVLLF